MMRHLIAIDSQRGMAKDDALPWHIPEDGKYFVDKTGTFGGNVLMGSKTLDAMKRPMVGRRNYIVSHRTDLVIPSATVVNNLSVFLDSFTDDLWIIGGSEIFAQTMDRADELYITEIAADFGCDKFYPAYKDSFELVHRSGPKTYQNLTYQFCIYRPKA